MKMLIDIDEDVRIAITRMGLLRISDEMQKKVDKAIQRGTPLDRITAEIKELNVDCDKAEWWSDGCEGYKIDGKLYASCKKCPKQRENSFMGDSLMIEID